jgi:hypothetical protein
MAIAVSRARGTMLVTTRERADRPAKPPRQLDPFLRKLRTGPVLPQAVPSDFERFHAEELR